MKMRVLVMSLILSAGFQSAFAEQPMAGMQMGGTMQMQPGTEQVIHHGVGKVVGVDKANLTVKLAHEAIKSLSWPGMTMDFKVAKVALLDGLKAGDAVAFDLGKGDKLGQWQIIHIALQGKK